MRPQVLCVYEASASLKKALKDKENERYRAPALDKRLDILELLAGVDGGLSQAEIAKRLGRSANEFYRMLDRPEAFATGRFGRRAGVARGRICLNAG